MKQIRICLMITLLLSTILTACNLPIDATATLPVMSDDAIGTAAALTVQALSTQLASPYPPTPPTTHTPFQATSEPTTQELIATDTPQPEPTDTGNSNDLPNDSAKFVDDITFPDDSVLTADTIFVKTWRLKNTGTTTWTTSYAVVFLEGDAMGAPAASPLSVSVAPDEEIDISVTLKAPTAAKSYQGFFKLRNSAGVLFGLGTKADKSFWVKIKVGTPTNMPFAVLSVPTIANTENYTGVCPYTFTFTAKIKTNNSGLVKFYWKFSDGNTTDLETLNFDNVGEKTVTTSWTLGSPDYTYDGWARIYIEKPNNQDFSKATFSVTCSP
jgi:hypothetical protein